MWKDAKYLIAYALPFAAALGLYLQGIWSFLGLFLSFVIIPLAELLIKPNPANLTPLQESSQIKKGFFDWLLYLNVPIVYGLVGYLVYLVAIVGVSTMEIVGMTLSVGIVVGSCGINVGHELGHRDTWYEQFMARLLLTPALYTHFTVEHNYGHHKYVATPADPATARLNEPLYAFWVRSITGAYGHAWVLQRELLDQQGKSFWDIGSNIMLQGSILQVLYLVAIGWVAGPTGVLLAVVTALIGILLLETVNYIEHYGLVRQQLASGRFEPVNPTHSWNSDHEMGRIFLYELTRHSDHHFKSQRKYQVLRHMDESPQLPFGYPTSIILAFIPPLWMRIMNNRALAAAKT